MEDETMGELTSVAVVAIVAIVALSTKKSHLGLLRRIIRDLGKILRRIW